MGVNKIGESLKSIDEKNGRMVQAAGFDCGIKY
jgi:hypothetical protein